MKSKDSLYVNTTPSRIPRSDDPQNDVDIGSNSQLFRHQQEKGKESLLSRALSQSVAEKEMVSRNKFSPEIDKLESLNNDDAESNMWKKVCIEFCIF